MAVSLGNLDSSACPCCFCWFHPVQSPRDTHRAAVAAPLLSQCTHVCWRYHGLSPYHAPYVAACMVMCAGHGHPNGRPANGVPSAAVDKCQPGGPVCELPPGAGDIPGQQSSGSTPACRTAEDSTGQPAGHQQHRVSAAVWVATAWPYMLAGLVCLHFRCRLRRAASGPACSLDSNCCRQHCQCVLLDLAMLLSLPMYIRHPQRLRTCCIENP